jgi:heme-degrading monooxygenase HmoA
MLYLFTVTVAEGYSAEQYADAWVRASRLIQQAPGARGTRLHRKLDDPRVLLAIASWDSKARRDAMEADPPEAVKAIIAAEAPFVSIDLIGEFDDPEWIVLPGESSEGT